jgi:hypothetical protein
MSHFLKSQPRPMRSMRTRAGAARRSTAPSEGAGLCRCGRRGALLLGRIPPRGCWRGGSRCAKRMGLSCWWREATRALIGSYGHTPLAPPPWTGPGPAPCVWRCAAVLRAWQKRPAAGSADILTDASRVPIQAALTAVSLTWHPRGRVTQRIGGDSLRRHLQPFTVYRL